MKVLDGKSLYETVPCNLCGSTEFRIVYSAAERPIGDLVVVFRSSTDEALKDQLVACASCGLQFINPRLRPDLILEGYREGSDETFVSQAQARERTFAKAMTLIEAQAPGRGHLLDVGTAAGSFLHEAAKRGWKVSTCGPTPFSCSLGCRWWSTRERTATSTRTLTSMRKSPSHRN